jgi:DNA-binding beta-propeller fold protein YncE
LNGVTDLAVHGSYLYVLDAGNCRVQKLDTSGSFVFQFGTQGTGNGQFAPGASGIAVDPEGRIYVADTGNHRIQKFASDGTFVASVGAFGSGNGEFNRPMGLCVGAGYAGRIHVADCGNHRIVVLETNLAYQTAFGTDGNGFNLQFHSPRSVSWNSGSGDLFVVDAGNHRIVACEPNGNATLHILGLPGRGTNRLFHPAAILPRGGMAIEILDAGNTRIAVFAYLG